MAQHRGTIKRILSDRGFGFIAPEGTDSKEQELFFHATAVDGTQGTFDQLREGQQVSYDVEQDPRGRGQRAIHVQAV